MSIAERLQIVESKMRQACQKEGVPFRPVTIVAVTKGQSVNTIERAYQAGLRHFGENYWQEARSKFFLLGEGKWVQEGDQKKFVPAEQSLPCRWHFIGRIQKNKIKDIVRFFSLIQSLDSLEHLEEIEKRAEKPVQVLLQVNLFGEKQKGGMKMAQVYDFIEKGEKLNKVTIAGLMMVAQEGAPEKELRNKFESLRRLFEELKAYQTKNVKMVYLSMGTSQDYPLAVAHGANMLRLGTILFGRREK